MRDRGRHARHFPVFQGARRSNREAEAEQVFMLSKQPSYREILGIRVQVNLLGMLAALAEANEKRKRSKSSEQPRRNEVRAELFLH